MPFTSSPADKIGAVTAAMTTAIDSIDDLAVYGYDPIGTEFYPPAAAVMSARLSRTRLGDPERQTPKDNWTFSHFVHVYVDLDAPDVAYAQMDAFVGQVVSRIDADWQLGGEVEEARVVEARWETTPPEAERRRLLVAVLEVQSIALMPRP